MLIKQYIKKFILYKNDNMHYTMMTCTKRPCILCMHVCLFQLRENISSGRYSSMIFDRPMQRHIIFQCAKQVSSYRKHTNKQTHTLYMHIRNIYSNRPKKIYQILEFEFCSTKYQLLPFYLLSAYKTKNFILKYPLPNYHYYYVLFLIILGIFVIFTLHYFFYSRS